ncbi:MAG: thioredoxin family protein [Chromatiaceae bacterium]|nr:thioredoxin family protein [Chromatiaceae bacterium]
MKVQIIATRACSHRPNLEHELRQLGVAYEVLYVEDHPVAAERLSIRHSPNLVVDGDVICRGQPTQHELQALFERHGS